MELMRARSLREPGSEDGSAGRPLRSARRAVYTAFGERVLADDGQGGPPAASRDGYAGAWGYETGLDDGREPDRPPLPFLHVGERWYDPATGRFRQRDPIGIRGGLGVFAYVESDPLETVDPNGLFGGDWSWKEFWGTTTGMAAAGAAGGALGVAPGVAAGATIGAATGATGYSGTFTFCAVWDLVGLWKQRRDAEQAMLEQRRQYPDLWPPPPPPQPPTTPPEPWQPRGWCFVGDTPVLTALGAVPIQDLGDGDTILGATAPNLSPTPATVLRGWRGTANALVRVVIDGEEIRCTAEHPFWEHSRGWVRASQLSRGDVLLTDQGCLVPVLETEQERLTTPVPVFNITVDGGRTFFVGKARVLVHNKRI